MLSYNIKSQLIRSFFNRDVSKFWSITFIQEFLSMMRTFLQQKKKSSTSRSISPPKNGEKNRKALKVFSFVGHGLLNTRHWLKEPKSFQQ